MCDKGMSTQEKKRCLEGLGDGLDKNGAGGDAVEVVQKA